MQVAVLGTAGGSSVPKPCAGREPVTADGCKASVQGATLCFDASGKDGARGRDGQRGAQDGSDGTRGSPGAPGSHGGSAVICLQGAAASSVNDLIRIRLVVQTRFSMRTAR
eukprot:4250044-Amphidinium_carterae.1